MTSRIGFAHFRKQLDLLEDEINFLSGWESLMSKVPLVIQQALSEIPSPAGNTQGDKYDPDAPLNRLTQARMGVDIGID